MEPKKPLTFSHLRHVEEQYKIYLKHLPGTRETFAVHKQTPEEPKIGEIVSKEEHFVELELRLKILELPGMNPVARPHETSHSC